MPLKLPQMSALADNQSELLSSVNLEPGTTKLLKSVPLYQHFSISLSDIKNIMPYCTIRYLQVGLRKSVTFALID